MVDLKTLAAEYDATKKTVKSSCKIKLTDTVAAKAKLLSPANKPSFELEGKHWLITYDVKSKDVELEGKWKTKVGELKIKQKVPGAKPEVLPSPEVQYKNRVVKGKKFAWELEPSYCFQSRKAKLDNTFELNGGKQKLKLEMDSKAGPGAAIGTLTTKVGNCWAKQLSLKYSRSAGASLIHEVEPSKQISLKSTVGIKAQDLKVVAEVKPGKISCFKPKITLEGKVSVKAPLRPTGVIAGLSLDC